jgi:hypothetical protein
MLTINSHQQNFPQPAEPYRVGHEFIGVDGLGDNNGPQMRASSLLYGACRHCLASLRILSRVSLLILRQHYLMVQSQMRQEALEMTAVPIDRL